MRENGQEEYEEFGFEPLVLKILTLLHQIHKVKEYYEAENVDQQADAL